MLRDDCMAQTSVQDVKCIVATCFMQQLLVEYPKCFIVGADNVGSKQMQRIRIALRGSAGNPSLCQFRDFCKAVIWILFACVCL